MTSDDDSPVVAFDPDTDPFVDGAHIDRSGFVEPIGGAEPDLDRLDFPGRDLRRFIAAQRRSLFAQLVSSRPLPRRKSPVRTWVKKYEEKH